MKYKDLTLGRLEAVVNKLGGMDAVERFLRGELAVSEVAASDLLRRIVSVTVVGAKKFTANDEQLKIANIGWTDWNFRHLFLDKTEIDVPRTRIAVHRLEKISQDAPILTELGNRAEISLSHLFSLLKRQAYGQQGPLLIDRYENIAYIRGNDGNLWAVNAEWNGIGHIWCVDASSVECSFQRHEGDQVLSRDS